VSAERHCHAGARAGWRYSEQCRRMPGCGSGRGGRNPPVSGRRLERNRRPAAREWPGKTSRIITAMAGFKSKEGAVVLLSGGMDSCVCAALAARDYTAAALHVSYGQRTEARERRAFAAICDRLGIEQRLVTGNEGLGVIGGSALTDAALKVPD